VAEQGAQPEGLAAARVVGPFAVRDVKARPLEVNGRVARQSANLLVACRAEHDWPVVEPLVTLKTPAANPAYIVISRHGDLELLSQEPPWSSSPRKPNILERRSPHG
jgi:hypothetical protein